MATKCQAGSYDANAAMRSDCAAVTDGNGGDAAEWWKRLHATNVRTRMLRRS